MAEKKIIELEVKTNTSDVESKFDSLQKQIDDTSKSVDSLSSKYGKNSKEVKKAEEELHNLNKAYHDLNKSVTNVNSTFEEVYGDLQPLTTRMGEAEDRLYELALAGNTTSKEYKELLEQVAKFRKTQIETDKVVDAAATTMTQKMSGALGGVTSGFAAYQGALGLIGVESEKVEEQLLKVQSAMALAESFQGLKEAKTSFIQLGSTIKTSVVTAFTTLRGAIIATGIGALAVILGAIIANWKEFSKAITDTFPGFKKVTDFFKNFSQVASGTINSVVAGFKTIGQVLGNIFSGDFSKAYDNAKKLGQNMAKAYNQGYDEKDKEIKTKQSIDNQKFEIDLMKAKGKNVLNAQLALQRKELSLLEKGSDEYKAKLIEIEESKTAILTKAAEDRAKAKELADKRAEELQKKKDEFAKKQAQDLEDALNMNLKSKEIEDPAKKAIRDARKMMEAQNVINEEKAKVIEVHNESELKLEEELKNKKIQMGQQAFGALSDLSTLFAQGNEAEQRKAFQLNKAANLGLAIMNTAQAVTGALTAGGNPLKLATGMQFVEAGIAATTGGINIARIAATQFQGTGGKDTATATPTAPRTPSFDIIQAQPQMQLGALQQQPVKAYVVSGEVSTAQALDRNRVRNATF